MATSRVTAETVTSGQTMWSSGTVIANVHDALSVGWSFAGIQVLTPSGSFTLHTPSSVAKTPASGPNS